MPANPNRFSRGPSLPRFVVICLGKGISVVDGRITHATVSWWVLLVVVQLGEIKLGFFIFSLRAIPFLYSVSVLKI